MRKLLFITVLFPFFEQQLPGALEQTTLQNASISRGTDTLRSRNPNGKNYHIAEWGNDQNDGLTAATAWKSIEKLNGSFSQVAPGDSLLFRSSNSFYGSIVAASSGIQGRPIVISSYGNGPRPIISGYTKLSNWTKTRDGIWEAVLEKADGELNIVTINGAMQQIGRFPNANAANSGWLKYATFNAGTPSITDATATDDINWTGAELAVRKEHWVIDRCPITAQQGGTYSYTSPKNARPEYFGSKGYGYFIQNDIRTLDKFGEFFLDKKTNRLSIFFGSAKPTSYIIRAATQDTLFHCGGKGRAPLAYITVDNLSFQGAGRVAFFAENGKDITVQNCSVNNAYDGLFIWNVTNSISLNNNISNCLNNGITQLGRDASPTTIRNNTVTKIGLFAGMGNSGGATYTGIRQNGSNTVVENNRLDSIGYTGIEWNGSNVSIQYNYVTNFCMTKDDGAGIYIWGKTAFVNRIIAYNTVIGGIGAPAGTADGGASTNCIYLDDWTNNVDVIHNTVSQTSNSGFFLNNCQNIRLSDNMIYNVPTGIHLARRANEQLLRNIIITSNTIYAFKTNIFYRNAQLYSPEITTIQEDMRAIGKLDSNYYRGDLAAPFDYFYHKSSLDTAGNFVDPPALNLTEWKSYVNQEKNSNTLNNGSPILEINPSAVSKTIKLDKAVYRGTAERNYNGSITLAPYSSMLLFK